MSHKAVEQAVVDRALDNAEENGYLCRGLPPKKVAIELSYYDADLEFAEEEEPEEYLEALARAVADWQRRKYEERKEQLRDMGKRGV